MVCPRTVPYCIQKYPRHIKNGHVAAGSRTLWSTERNAVTSTSRKVVQAIALSHISVQQTIQRMYLDVFKSVKLLATCVGDEIQQVGYYLLQLQYSVPCGYSPSLKRSIVVAAVFQQWFSALPFINIAKLDIRKSNSITYPQRSPSYLTIKQHLQDQHFHQQSLQINLAFCR